MLRKEEEGAGELSRPVKFPPHKYEDLILDLKHPQKLLSMEHILGRVSIAVIKYHD